MAFDLRSKKVRSFRQTVSNRKCVLFSRVGRISKCARVSKTDSFVAGSALFFFSVLNERAVPCIQADGTERLCGEDSVRHVARCSEDVRRDEFVDLEADVGSFCNVARQTRSASCRVSKSSRSVEKSGIIALLNSQA